MNTASAEVENSVSSHGAANTSLPKQQTETLYNRVGGEEGLRKLIETFYDIIEFEPPGHELHILHLKGHGVAHSRIEQFNFLSGFLGGPQLYIEKYKHSNVRQMHVHVEIDASARDAWLECMLEAINRLSLPTDVKDDLMVNFTRVAFQLKNKD